MAREQEMNEKRKHTRYLAKDGTYAVLSFTPKNIKLGRVVDVSKSGMAFFYESREEWPLEPDTLNILYGDENYYLDNIPFQTITDTTISNATPFARTTMRRRGVMFGNLSPSQMSQLDYFIWHLTAGTK